MKKITILLLSFIASSAFADIRSNHGFYVGGGVAQIDLDVGGDVLGESSYDWTAIELMGGYKHNSFVGGELRLGVFDGSDPYMSAYYRVESANDVSKTYLLGGYTFGTVSGDTDDEDFSGFSYGAGVGFVIFDTLNLNFEYRVLCKDNKNDLDFRSINVGVDYRF